MAGRRLKWNLFLSAFLLLGFSSPVLFFALFCFSPFFSAAENRESFSFFLRFFLRSLGKKLSHVVVLV